MFGFCEESSPSEELVLRETPPSYRPGRNKEASKISSFLTHSGALSGRGKEGPREN